MARPSESEHGILAILDALGAANYADTEIRRFIDSRRIVLELLNLKAQDIFGDIRANMITTFTFNDTVIIALQTGNNEPRLSQISDFFKLMRKFLVDSLAKGILFRGAIAIDSFYINDETNTIMGPAVTDAAAWYDKADWIGLHATPHASMIIQRWQDHNEKTRRHVMLDYEVPIKASYPVRAKAVNWPKVFFVPDISPSIGTKPRVKLLEFLTPHQMPVGTETKYYNTLAFFDFAVKQIAIDEKKARRKRSPD